jgi:hypothetical protein
LVGEEEAAGAVHLVVGWERSVQARWVVSAALVFAGERPRLLKISAAKARAARGSPAR